MRDRSWVKSRIAARILLRGVRRQLQERDRRLAWKLSKDPGVTDRLIDQALACICAEKQIAPEDYNAIVRSALAARH
jgi:hypothetical protein